MAVKIKLKRLGKIRAPHYRIVVADARTKRDGRAIEEIGKYHPKQDPSLIEVDSERAQYWLGVGAQPTEPVAAILKVTGDWQKFKGLPGAEGTLRVAEPKADKQASSRRPPRSRRRAPRRRDHAEEERRQEGRSPGRGAAARPRRGDAAAEAPTAEAQREAPERPRRAEAEHRGARRRATDEPKREA